jgi:hypothetical protein
MIFMYGRKVKDYGTSTWLRSIDVPRLDSVMITTSRAAGTVRQPKVKIPDPIHKVTEEGKGVHLRLPRRCFTRNHTTLS